MLSRNHRVVVAVLCALALVMLYFGAGGRYGSPRGELDHEEQILRKLRDQVEAEMTDMRRQLAEREHDLAACRRRCGRNSGGGGGGGGVGSGSSAGQNATGGNGTSASTALPGDVGHGHVDATAAGAHVLPLIVARRGVADARGFVGTHNHVNLAKEEGVERRPTLIFPFDVTFADAAELAVLNNTVLGVLGECFERADGYAEATTLNLHALGAASRALPAQPLALVDARNWGQASKRFDWVSIDRELDAALEKHAERPVAVGCGAAGLGTTKSDALAWGTRLLAVPARSRSPEWFSELDAWLEEDQTVGCMERPRAAFPSELARLTPSRNECERRAAEFVSRWLSPASAACRPPSSSVETKGPGAGPPECGKYPVRRSPEVSAPLSPPSRPKETSVCMAVPILTGELKGGWAKHSFFSVFVNSMVQTLAGQTSPRRTLRFRTYVGYNDGDKMDVDPVVRGAFAQLFAERTKELPMELFVQRFPRVKFDPVFLWNSMFDQAYADGCAYLLHMGDDVRLTKKNWAHHYIDAFEDADPPSIGLGGGAGQFNTQPFVSRSHISLFGHFYPPYMANWYTDTAVNGVYTKSLRLGGNFGFENQNKLHGGKERYGVCVHSKDAAVQRWAPRLQAVMADPAIYMSDPILFGGNATNLTSASVAAPRSSTGPR